jgi:hypothetical protein
MDTDSKLATFPLVKTSFTETKESEDFDKVALLNLMTDTESSAEPLTIAEKDGAIVSIFTTGGSGFSLSSSSSLQEENIAEPNAHNTAKTLKDNFAFIFFLN